MLFLKPFYLRHEHNKARAMGYRGIGESTRVSALDDDDEESGSSPTLNGNRESFGDDEDGAALITQDIGHGDHDGHEEFEFSEEMIHQVIHTIGKFHSARLIPHSPPPQFPH
jgi:V-type H+-transporting ATPase subunit a